MVRHGQNLFMPLAILEKEDVAFRATVWKCQPAILMMEKAHEK